MFTVKEQKLIDIIGKHGPMKIKDVAEMFYDGDVPLNGQVNISNTIRRIAGKCEYDKEKFTIAGDYGLGRTGRLVWIEKRKAK